MKAARYKETHRFCRRLFRKKRPGLFALSYSISVLERRALFSLFAFHDFVTSGFAKASTPGTRSQHFKSCEELINRIYDHTSSKFELPFEFALEQTVTRFEISSNILMKILEGALLETLLRQPTTEDELILLSDNIGGVWGYCLSMILNPIETADQTAWEVGKALWLTERATNFKSEIERKKNYFPVAWSVKAGISFEDNKELFQEMYFNWSRSYLDTTLENFRNLRQSRFRLVADLALKAQSLKMQKGMSSPRLTLREKVKIFSDFLRLPI